MDVLDAIKAAVRLRSFTAQELAGAMRRDSKTGFVYVHRLYEAGMIEPASKVPPIGGHGYDAQRWRCLLKWGDESETPPVLNRSTP